MNNYPTNKRAVGVIIKDNNILLIKRIKNGRLYFIFPGGSVERGETIEDTVIREMKEEVSLNVKPSKLLFQIKNRGREEYYFLIKEFSGTPAIGGPEKERMNEDNQYHPIWIPLTDLINLDNLHPEEARLKVYNLFK